MAYMEYPVIPDTDPDPSWKCHHCGAIGDDEAGMNQATHVTEDQGALVYLRPYCDGCVPSPPGRIEPSAPEWQNFYHASGSLQRELQAAVDNGAVRASTAHQVTCPICGLSFTAGRIGLDLVYAVAADQDESACVRCIETVPPAEIAQAYRRRAHGVTN